MTVASLLVEAGDAPRQDHFHSHDCYDHTRPFSMLEAHRIVKSVVHPLIHTRLVSINKDLSALKTAVSPWWAASIS